MATLIALTQLNFTKGVPMKDKNPFDRKIELNKGMPVFVRNAAIELTDTLDLCWAAAQAVFEGKAKPEHALALLPMFMERADGKRQQALTQHHDNMAAASARIEAKRGRKPPPKAK